MNIKNEEIAGLQKEIANLDEDKINKLEPNTNESSSLSRNYSDSILMLLKLMEISTIGSRYTEDNLKAALRKYQNYINKFKKLEEDNVSLRNKLDEVNN